MGVLDPKEICEIVEVGDPEFTKFIEEKSADLSLVPEIYPEYNQPVLRSDAGDFAKWLAAHNPELKVLVKGTNERLDLRSDNVWLPLVFLANNVVLPVYLNLVSSYLFERMRGALRSETARVNFSAEYHDQAAGTTKRFNFQGDAESLKKVINEFDLNRFLGE